MGTKDQEEYSPDSSDALHEWAAAHNLSEIVLFHNAVRACLAEKASEAALMILTKLS